MLIMSLKTLIETFSTLADRRNEVGDLFTNRTLNQSHQSHDFLNTPVW